MGAGVLLGKALGRLIGIWRDSMLLCRPESLGYMRASLGTLNPLMSSRPWEKLAELILRIGAGLGVKQEAAEIVACGSGTFGAWASLAAGRSRLLELTLSRLASEGGLTKLLTAALRSKEKMTVQGGGAPHAATPRWPPPSCLRVGGWSRRCRETHGGTSGPRRGAASSLDDRAACVCRRPGVCV